MSDLIQTIEEGDDDGVQEPDDDALELADKEEGPSAGTSYAQLK